MGNERRGVGRTVGDIGESVDEFCYVGRDDVVLFPPTS